MKFTEFNDSDNTLYCLNEALLQLVKLMILFFISISAVIMNEILSELFIFLQSYLKRYMKTEERATSFQQIIALELCNLGIVALISGFDVLGINHFFFAGDVRYNKLVYNGFNTGWYIAIGQWICYQLYMSSFFKNSLEIFHYLIILFKRWKDRGFRINIKKNQDNDQCVEVLTRQKS